MISTTSFIKMISINKILHIDTFRLTKKFIFFKNSFLHTVWVIVALFLLW